MGLLKLVGRAWARVRGRRAAAAHGLADAAGYTRLSSRAQIEGARRVGLEVIGSGVAGEGFVRTEALTQRLQEGLLDAGIYQDPDLGLTASQGGAQFFRRLTQAPRDLNTITQELALQLCYFLADSNPLAKRVLELTRDYVVGEGITVRTTEKQGATEPDEAKETPVQDALDRFWDDPINRMDAFLHEAVWELGLAGEQCWTVTVNPIDGHVRVGYVDPERIKDVLCDPQNVRIVRAVVLKGEGGGRSERLKVVQMDEDPLSPSYGRRVGVQTSAVSGTVTEMYQDEGANYPYLGACFFWAINKPIGAKRGRSDLLTLVDWIDAYDQLSFGEVDRGLLMKSFIWDITCEGMNQGEIDAFLLKNGAPKPGSVRAHNEKVTWAAVSPDLKSADAQIGIDMLVSTVAAGSGLAKTWLAGVMDVNKATAAELGEPAFKRLTARQKVVKAIVLEVCAFALDRAELAGRLPPRPKQKGSPLPEPWPLQVNTPDLRTKDMQGAADTLNKSMGALAAGIAERVIDVELAQEVLAVLVGQLGIDVDLEALRERLAKQAEEEANAMPPVVNVTGVDATLDAKKVIPAAATVDGGPGLAGAAGRGGNGTH